MHSSVKGDGSGVWRHDIAVENGYDFDTTAKAHLDSLLLRLIFNHQYFSSLLFSCTISPPRFHHYPSPLHPYHRFSLRHSHTPPQTLPGFLVCFSRIEITILAIVVRCYLIDLPFPPDAFWTRYFSGGSRVG
jgi:hypothetical protein